ncbi:MAG: hypothetical protein FJ304_07675 [Planctomycetes bacterium]|nr:hypothetical protein [Planctomycetota bacterium]
MSRRARLVLPVLGLVLLLPACAPPAAAPVAGHVGTVAFRSAKWIASYLLGMLAEGVWDSATGKSDVELLKRRIEELERQSDVRPEHRAELKQLRELVYAGITRAEYERYVSDTSDRLTKIEDRLTKLEQRVDKLEAKQGGGAPTTVNVTAGTVWRGRLTQHNGATVYDCVFTVTSRTGANFEAALYEKTGDVELTYLVRGTVAPQYAGDTGFRIEFTSFDAINVKNTLVMIGVPYTGRLEGSRMKGTWQVPDGSVYGKLQGDFEFDLSR